MVCLFCYSIVLLWPGLAVKHVVCCVCRLLFLDIIYTDLFAEHLDPINVKIAELGEALESVTAEQKYLRARDARHRHSESPIFSLIKA